MKVSIAIERSILVPAPPTKVKALLEDLEGTISRFPKLRNLSRLDDNAYLWEMEPIGSQLAGIAHEVSYGAKYDVDPKKGVLSWKPVRGHGNALIEGMFQLAPQSDATELHFHVRGDLHDVPVPFVYRLVAPPFIQGKFTRLVDIFLDRTREALLQPAAAAPARRRSTR